MNIWSPKGMKGSACCKIPYKGYEISIAMDDSCGAMSNYARSDIRVYQQHNGLDVTQRLIQNERSMLYGDAETLKYVFSWIDMFGDRD